MRGDEVSSLSIPLSYHVSHVSYQVGAAPHIPGNGGILAPADGGLPGPGPGQASEQGPDQDRHS